MLIAVVCTNRWLKKPPLQSAGMAPCRPPDTNQSFLARATCIPCETSHQQLLAASVCNVRAKTEQEINNETQVPVRKEVARLERLSVMCSKNCEKRLCLELRH